MNNAPSRMLPWHLKMCDWLENIINKHPKLFFFTLRWWNQSSKNIKLRRTESSHVSSCRLPVLTLSSLVVPNRLVHHNQPCDFYAIYTYFALCAAHYIEHTTHPILYVFRSAQCSLSGMARRQICSTWHMLCVHTAPFPKHKHFFNYTPPEWTPGWADGGDSVRWESGDSTPPSP